jgi:Fe2+ or Zn2+ uptake regulation protein
VRSLTQICCNNYAILQQMEEFQKLLQEHHLRITNPRKAVFEMLLNANEPVSIHSLVQSLPTVDRVSIYRILETFGTAGITKLVYTGWKKRYELSDTFLPHHHHLHCLRCNKTIALADDRIESLISSLAKSHDFAVQTHSFEIEGTCQDCLQITKS